jgi:hypothetical protein
MEEQDISIEQVLQIAKTKLPEVDDNTILEQFEVMKAETGLNNYETVLFLMKKISESSQPVEQPQGRFSELTKKLTR